MMATQQEIPAHETETAQAPEQDINLVVWQQTTMLEPLTVDGVSEDNILRSID
jgi:hypothetical protein